jgi:hypothetical protein
MKDLLALPCPFDALCAINKVQASKPYRVPALPQGIVTFTLIASTNSSISVVYKGRF